MSKELTSAELQRMNEWFRAVGMGGACEVCGQRMWTEPFHSHMRVDLQFGTEHVRTIVLVCGNCGNEWSFAAAMMGL